MSRKKPRSLNAEEKALWEKVIEKAVPLHPHPPRPVEAVESAKTPHKPKIARPKPSLPRFRVGEKAQGPVPGHDLAAPIAAQLAARLVAMDQKAYGRMKKGRLAPEARIDLHGMTIAEAHPALLSFIMESAAEGRRLVLVITGKGKSRPDEGPMPVRHGVLRHQVPHWLNTQPLKPLVLQISEAHLKHGGQGAYYVYLRRNR